MEPKRAIKRNKHGDGIFNIQSIDNIILTIDYKYKNSISLFYKYYSYI